MTDNVTPNRRDTLFAELVAEPSTFSFNDAVVDVFPDMIQRSVPGYGTVVKMSGDPERTVRKGRHPYLRLRMLAGRVHSLCRGLGA